MPKRVSEIEIKEMLEGFSNGKTIQELANRFKCTKNTVTRHLKKNFNDKDFKIIAQQNKFTSELEVNNLKSISNNHGTQKLEEENFNKDPQFDNDLTFVEIAPVNTEIINDSQKISHPFLYLK